MKKLLPVICFVLCLAGGTAQAQVFSKGVGHLNLGVGIGGYLSYAYFGDFSSTPTIFISYDHGIVDGLGPGNLGIGGFVGYKSSTYNYNYGGYGDKGTWTDIVIGARGNYHYILDNEKIDLYGGLSLGLVMQSYKFTSDNPYYTGFNYDTNSSFVYYAFNVGGKYFFTEKLGVFAELGYDVSYVKLGLTLSI